MAGSELPVRIVDADGKQITNFGSSVGPTPSATSQSVTPATDTAPFPVVGNSASGAADTGNPVKVGARVLNALPTLSPGQRSDVLIDTLGQLRVSERLTTNTASDAFANNLTAMPYDVSTTNLLLRLTGGYVFNGVTWDRARGDVTGSYVVSKGGSNIATGQVSVTTASTLVVAARAGRQKVTLTPTSATVYYVGVNGVTTATGVYVAAGGSITLDTAAAVYAVGASALTVSYIEFY